MNRKCSTCKEQKDLECFSREAGRSLGHTYTCKTCSKRNARRHILRMYGLTEETYQTLLTKQDNKCAVCLEQFKNNPHIDHNHSSGQVRGLLCTNCNRGIGLLKDNPETLQRAATYLVMDR